MRAAAGGGTSSATAALTWVAPRSLGLGAEGGRDVLDAQFVG
jgi:hypothetical protein